MSGERPPSSKHFPLLLIKQQAAGRAAAKRLPPLVRALQPPEKTHCRKARPRRPPVSASEPCGADPGALPSARRAPLSLAEPTPARPRQRSSEPTPARSRHPGALPSVRRAPRSLAEPTLARPRQASALLGAARSRPRHAPVSQARSSEPRAAVPGARRAA